MPPSPIKSGQGGFKHFSWVIPSEKTLMARWQPTQRGVKESSWPGLRYKAWGCQVPLMGPQMHQLLDTLYVASSLTLFSLAGSDPTGGFWLRTLSCCRPTTIMGPVLDIVIISHDVEGARAGVGVACELMFTASVRACHFASLVVTPQGYKAGGCPYVNLRPLTRPPIVSSPPSLRV
jgi:hypothetical protein